LLPGLGAARAAADRTAQGQVGDGFLPAGAPRLPARRFLVRPVPAHLRAVRAGIEAVSVGHVGPTYGTWTAPGTRRSGPRPRRVPQRTRRPPGADLRHLDRPRNP